MPQNQLVRSYRLDPSQIYMIKNKRQSTDMPSAMIRPEIARLDERESSREIKNRY